MQPAQEKHENLGSFSSGGPTADGRIKPEVVAPGDAVVSAALVASDDLPRSKRFVLIQKRPIYPDNVEMLSDDEVAPRT